MKNFSVKLLQEEKKKQFLFESYKSLEYILLIFRINKLKGPHKFNMLESPNYRLTRQPLI